MENILNCNYTYKASWCKFLSDFSLHSVLFATSFFIKDNLIILPFLSLILHRNYVVFHDCQHNSYCPNKFINYLLSLYYGITTFSSPNWILDHSIHHLTNGNKTNKYNFKFNELLYYNVSNYKKFNTLERMIFTFFHTPIVFFTFFPILYFGVIQRFIYIIKKIKYKSKIKDSMKMILFNHIVNNIGSFCMCLFLYKYNRLSIYLVCCYFSFIINFLFFFNQHTFNPCYIANNESWTQLNSGLLGSSFIQIPKFLKYFTMGIEYHHIHHVNSKIPGYNLQSYHNEIVSKCDLFDNIVKLSMKDCYNNLWLVLYDDKDNKYKSIKDLKDE